MKRLYVVAVTLCAIVCFPAPATAQSLPAELQSWSQKFCRELESNIARLPEANVQQQLLYFTRQKFRPALAAVVEKIPVEYHPFLFARMKARTAPTLRTENLDIGYALFNPDQEEILIASKQLHNHDDMWRTMLHEMIHHLIEPRRSQKLLQGHDHSYLYEGMTEYLTLAAAQRLGWKDLKQPPCYADDVTVIALLLPTAGLDLWHWYLVKVDIESPSVHDHITNRLISTGINQDAAKGIVGMCQQKYDAYYDFVYQLPPAYLKRAYAKEAEAQQRVVQLDQERKRLQSEGVPDSDERLIHLEYALERNLAILNAAEYSIKVARQAAERDSATRKEKLQEILDNQHVRLIQAYQANGLTNRQIWDQQLKQGTPNAILWHIRAAMMQK